MGLFVLAGFLIARTGALSLRLVRRCGDSGSVIGVAVAGPQLNRYYGPLQPVTATFIPEAGHVYEAWTVAAQGACRLDYWRWSWALFGAGQQLTPTAPPPPLPPAQAAASPSVHAVERKPDGVPTPDLATDTPRRFCAVTGCR